MRLASSSLPLILLCAACAGGGDTSTDIRELRSGETIEADPGPVEVHASGQSRVVLAVDPTLDAGVGEIPDGAHVRLEDGKLKVDGHGVVELHVRELADVRVTGHSTIELRCLDDGALAVRASGHSTAILQGSLDALDARATGHSTILGNHLTVASEPVLETHGKSNIDLSLEEGAEPDCTSEGGGGSGGGGEGGAGGGQGGAGGSEGGAGGAGGFPIG